MRENRIVEVTVDQMRRPRTPIPYIILPPGDIVSRMSRADDIHIPIPVHIRRIHESRTQQVAFDEMGRPRAPIPHLILPPGDVVGLVGGPEHIHIPIPIHIRRMHGNGPIEVTVDQMGRPRTPISYIVLPPGDIIGKCRRTEDVHIPIAVHIGGVHEPHPIKASIDQVGYPRTSIPPPHSPTTSHHRH